MPTGQACEERLEFQRLWAEQERQLAEAEAVARARREERKKKLQQARAAKAAKKAGNEPPIGSISAAILDGGVGEASIDDMAAVAPETAPATATAEQEESRGERLKRLAAERCVRAC